MMNTEAILEAVGTPCTAAQGKATNRERGIVRFAVGCWLLMG